MDQHVGNNMDNTFSSVKHHHYAPEEKLTEENNTKGIILK